MKANIQLANYLDQNSRNPTALCPIAKERLKGLPGFLALGYVFHDWTWMNQKLVLAEVTSGGNDLSPTQLVDQQRILQNHFKQNVAFVFPTLDAYRRDRLIKLGIPFIVPGWQFYMPPWANLTEHFARMDRPEKLSPPAQVVVLYQLLRHPPEATLLNQWAGWIGYSAMTLSKVRNELVTLGLCVAGPGEKPRGLHFMNQGRSLWDSSKSALGSPIRWSYWALLPASNPGLLIAGTTALSRVTMLGGDSLPTYACRDAEWRRMVQANRVQVAAHPGEATDRIECWRYDPRILGGEGVVDRFSLYLSLVDHPDERVRLAAESLLESMSW